MALRATAAIKYGTGGPTYYLNGVEVSKEAFDKRLPPKPLGAPRIAAKSCWPLRSEALACHPDTIQEHMDRNKLHGIGTTYDADGTAIIPDRNDRKKLLAVEGFHDKQGGYGD